MAWPDGTTVPNIHWAALETEHDAIKWMIDEFHYEVAQAKRHPMDPDWISVPAEWFESRAAHLEKLYES
jgi:hypothetical protein